MHNWKTALLVLVTLLAFTKLALAEDGVVFESPELVVVRTGTTETCMMPGSGYADFSLDGKEATWTITGQDLPAGSKLLMAGGISKISWEPVGDQTAVKVTFKTEPTSSMINALAGTQLRPQTEQVVVGFGYPGELGKSRRPGLLGHRSRNAERAEDQFGNYELPAMPKAHYSDALVTLKVENTDFREVLWLLSEIGGISILLDPYWDDEPTGSRRPPGGGANGPGGGSGSGGAGFRGAGGFVPTPPRSGTGNLTLNFIDVPFDTALDLVVMSAGLVKVDIWPGDM